MKQRDDSQVNAFDAKTHLSQLLREAEQGRSITITRHGKPVARLVPMDTSSGLEAGELITAFRCVRQAGGKPLKVKHLIREGRKY
jgi:prevent-host-death family protein